MMHDNDEYQLCELKFIIEHKTTVTLEIRLEI